MMSSPSAAGCGARACRSDLDAGAPGFLEQKAHRLERRDVRLRRVEESGVEPPGEIRLQRADAPAPPLVALREPGEARDLGAVARGRHHQRAAAHRAGIGVLPNLQRLEPKGAHDGLGRLVLAVGREHGAGIGAGRLRERFGGLLDEPYAMAAPRQRQGLPQAGDAGAGDGDREGTHGADRHSPRATPSRRGSAPPSSVPSCER